MDNSYPKEFINYVIKYKKKKNSNEKFSFSFPYVNQSKNIVRTILESLNSKIKIAFGNYTTFDKIYSRTKDQTPIGKKYGVVYGIPCLVSPNFMLVSMQLLSKRIYQHKNIVRNNSDKTAPAVHKKLIIISISTM